MRNFKNLMVLSAVLAFAGCAKTESVKVEGEKAAGALGNLTVSVCPDVPKARAVVDYQKALTEESAVFKVDVMVFDAQTQRLEQSASLESFSQECSFELPVGQKVVYALVNGPDVTRVQNVSQLLALNDDLSTRNLAQDGFMMLGSEECDVVAGSVAQPEIMVRRLVSRIELRSVKCDVAAQYGGMTVESVFLGNAYSIQTLAGDVSAMVNLGGYADSQKTQPIGLDGVTGVCPGYMYRGVAKNLTTGASMTEPSFMYCHPNGSAEYTCLYILATVGGEKYYYRVPFDKGLAGNTTYIVDAVITNLGAPLPPDGVIQKGEIKATITIADWEIGDSYHAEF
jgi:hypothetical protein